MLEVPAEARSAAEINPPLPVAETMIGSAGTVIGKEIDFASRAGRGIVAVFTDDPCGGTERGYRTICLAGLPKG
jgi:hypothetical protein